MNVSSLLCLTAFVFMVRAEASTYTLELVSAIFRHGDRSPVGTYPNDPYQEDFWPQGFGQLSLEGMRQEYDLGQWLRREYADNVDFVNGNYSVKEVKINSTDVDRTLMSAEALLAALFAPGPDQQFNLDLNWQPVPVHTVPKEEDKMLNGFSLECPAYTQEMEESFQQDEYLAVAKENEGLFEELSNYTGMEVNISNFVHVWNPLLIEDQNNLTMPPWFNDNLLANLTEIAKFTLAYKYNSDLKRKVAGGVWANTVITNMVNKAAGTSDMADLKLLLYSAHDTTVAAMLSVFGLWDGNLPEYASAFIVELVSDKSGENYYVNFHYHNETGENGAAVLQMQGCSVPCPLSQVKSIMSPYMVTVSEWDQLCQIATPSDNKGVIVEVILGIILVVVALAAIFEAILLCVLCWKYRVEKKKNSKHGGLLGVKSTDTYETC